MGQGRSGIDSPNPARTIARSTQNAVAGRAHRAENDPKSQAKNPKNGRWRPKSAAWMAKMAVTAARSRLTVHEILAGEFGLAGNEGESRLCLGAHQALDRSGGAFAIVGQKHHAQQDALGRVHGGFL